MLDVKMRCAEQTGCYQAHKLVTQRLDEIGLQSERRDHLFCIDPLRKGQIILRSSYKTSAILGEVRDIPDITEKKYDFCVRVSPVQKDKTRGNARYATNDLETWRGWHFSEKSCGISVQKICTRYQMTFCAKGEGFWLPDVVMVGRLLVVDPMKTMVAMTQGIGRHRAFGFGLLQIFPV